MALYAGIDLHSRNTYLGIMNSNLRRVFKKRVANDLELILKTLDPFRHDLIRIVVESTYNCYWLVDGLMDAGYGCLHLANPSAIKQYEGLKYKDDVHDAFFLTHLLALGILPEGYIYPKKDRPVRDLLRKRSFLVKQRSSHILSLQSMIERNTAQRLNSNKIKDLNSWDLERVLQEEYVVLAAKANNHTIKFLSEQIRQIEVAVKEKVKLTRPFKLLLTVPGIGDILAMTIMLEVGDINRFGKVGNFASYCRCVSSQRTSDGKTKGRGNRKNGNRYLKKPLKMCLPVS